MSSGKFKDNKALAIIITLIAVSFFVHLYIYITMSNDFECKKDSLHILYDSSIEMANNSIIFRYSIKSLEQSGNIEIDYRSPSKNITHTEEIAYDYSNNSIKIELTIYPKADISLADLFNQFNYGIHEIQDSYIIVNTAEGYYGFPVKI